MHYLREKLEKKNPFNKQLGDKSTYKVTMDRQYDC